MDCFIMCILLMFVADISLKSPLGTWNKRMYVCMISLSKFTLKNNEVSTFRWSFSQVEKLILVCAYDT